MSEPLEIISLVRADLLKAQKNPTNWIVISIAAALTTMGVFNERSLSFRAFGFPDGLLVGPENVGPLLALVIMPIGAISAGVEYRYDTWKNLLTRRPGRAGFIIGKWITFVLIVNGVMVTLSLWSQALAGFLGGGPSQPGHLKSVVAELGIYAIEMIIVGSIALLGTILRRSAVVGIMFSTVWFIADEGRLLSRIYGPLKLCLFSTAKVSMLAHLCAYESGRPISAATDVLVLSIPVSLLVMASYLVIPVVVATFAFSRQDMAG